MLDRLTRNSPPSAVPWALTTAFGSPKFARSVRIAWLAKSPRATSRCASWPLRSAATGGSGGRGRARSCNPGAARAALRCRARGVAQVAAPGTPKSLAPGAASGLSVWVTNLGSSAWGTRPISGTTNATSRKPVGAEPATHAELVGTWLPLGVTDERQVQAAAAASMTSVELPAAFAPRAISQANLSVFAPTAEGDYLLVIDIITPEVGSLAAQGVEPTIVRVHVAEPAPAVTPTPAPTLAPTPSPSATASTSPLPPAPED